MASHINDLPLEILVEFFTTLSSLHNRSSTATFLIASVCTLWREIAFNTPILWEILHIGGLQSNSLDGFLEQWELWQANSKNIGISLELTVPNACGEEAWQQALKKTIIEGGKYYRKLNLTFVDDGLINSLFSLPSESYVFERLESLFLELPYLETTKTMYETQAFKRCPRLHKVSIDWDQDIPLPIPLELPWSQLTHLSVMDCISSQSWRTILHQCPSLQHYVTSIADGGFAIMPKELVHTSLLELSITFHDILQQSFFSSISLPSLQDFRILFTFERDWPPSTTSWWPAQLFQAPTLLVRLTLVYQRTRCDELIALLGNTPLLEYLHVDSALHTFTPFFDALYRGFFENNPSALVPKLKELHVCMEHEDRHIISFDPHAFLRMVAARASLGCLKHVQLWIARRALDILGNEGAEGLRAGMQERGLLDSTLYISISDPSNWMKEKRPVVWP